MSLDQDSNERVLAAAGDLSRLAEGGFTMAQLARRAGMSRATLYRRFGGRAAVVAALRERGAAPATARERLLAATLELLGERGPLGFSLEEVAARAGASVTTIYRMFGEREGLVREAVRRLASPAGLRALLADPEAPVRATLAGFVAAVIARLEGQPLLLRLMFTPDLEGWRYLQRVRERESRMSRALLEYFEAQLGRGRVRGESAAALTTTMMGLVLGDLLRGRLDEVEARPGPAARARAIVDVFLDGVGRGPRRAR
jgi:AcrR family transcriptional regulator